MLFYFSWIKTDKPNCSFTKSEWIFIFLSNLLSLRTCRVLSLASCSPWQKWCSSLHLKCHRNCGKRNSGSSWIPAVKVNITIHKQSSFHLDWNELGEGKWFLSCSSVCCWIPFLWVGLNSQFKAAFPQCSIITVSTDLAVLGVNRTRIWISPTYDWWKSYRNRDLIEICHLSAHDWMQFYCCHLKSYVMFQPQ